VERAKNGWTGAQYSALRIVLATCVVLHGVDVWLLAGEGSPLQRWSAVSLLTVIALPLALGTLDRVAAVALALLLLLHRFLDGVPELLTAWPAFESVLLLHAFVPPAPYGAWAARGRPDPGGGWRLPDRLHDAAWLVVGLSHLLAGLATTTSATWLASATGLEWALCAVHLGFLPLALVPGGRPLALCLGLASLLAGPLDGNLILAFGAHLACFTPAWFAPRPGPPQTLFYDGECGLCHRAVRFFLAEDPGGDALHYAPLHSPAFMRLVSEAAREALPDSLVLVTDAGTVHVRSEAVMLCLERLGGGWRIASWAMRVFPGPLRDLVYDLVAAGRRRLFAAPTAACPIVPPALRDRFVV
jgi:predicted DCC family thiol-disulfide oxidoreductase YuxK